MTIIHGDNQVASRQFFVSLKDLANLDGQQVVDLPGDNLTLGELVTAADSVSLLGAANAVFIEGFFSRRPSNTKKAISDYLSSHPDSVVTLWEGKDVTAQLKSFITGSIKKFDLPKYIWQFLDTLSLDHLRHSLTTTEPEALLALLAGRLHQLIMVKDSVTPPGLAGWQTNKLKTLSSKFSTSQLLSLHSQLLTLDYRQKTSSTPLNLASALELWIISHVR